MHLIFMSLFILVVSLTGCSDLVPNKENTIEDDAVPVNQDGVEFSNADILASYLTVPWDIVKIDNEFFISERGGRIIHITENQQKQEMPLKLKEDVVEKGEGGLLGFVLDPNFTKNSLAYIYHSYVEGGHLANRIVQIKKKDEEWVEEKVLLASLPGGTIHNGGRLEIGPDHKLYATVGDAGNPESAQNLNSLSGKILRMNFDGSVPTDNPYNTSFIYSYGHRNPQGITWDEQGKMYSAEHGAVAHDEINEILPGGNYGWPIIQGNEQKVGLIPPLFHSDTDTWAPSGLTYYKEKLYVAALRSQQIRGFDLRSGISEPVYENVGRIRDLFVEGDSLYLITNNTDGRGEPDQDDDHLLKVDFRFLETAKK